MKLRISIFIYIFLLNVISVVYSEPIIVPQYYAIETNQNNDQKLLCVIDKVCDNLNKKLASNPAPIYSELKIYKKFIQIKDLDKGVYSDVIIATIFKKKANGIYPNRIGIYNITNGKREQIGKCSMWLHKNIDDKEIALNEEELEKALIEQIVIISYKFNPPINEVEREYERLEKLRKN